MSRPFHVIIPTLYREHARNAFVRLDLLPQPNVVHIVNDAGSWPSAVNKGLEAAAGREGRLAGRNVIIMDDDIELNPHSFAHLDKALDQADIIGFRLIHANGDIQHAGGVFITNEQADSVCDRYDLTHRTGGAMLDHPVYVPHVTTSLTVIKGEVFDEIGTFETGWDGLQFEDADFMFRALNAGFKILYWPSVAIHHESRTKNPEREAAFFDQARANYARLKQRWFTPEFIELCEQRCPGCIATLQPTQESTDGP